MRWIPATLLSLLLAATVPHAGAAEMTAHEKALYEAAKAGNETATWYESQYRTETAEAIGRAFREKYPGVGMNVIRSTAQVIFQRLSQDNRAGVTQCDVFSSTDASHLVQLKQDGLLMKYVPENQAKAIEAFRTGDADGYFHTTQVSMVALTYNTNLVKESEAPKTWLDLIDPKWKGQVSVGHPGFSGRVGNWVVAMRKMYGWEYFEKLEKNKPQIGRSIVDTVTMLTAGERKVAAGSVSSTRPSIAQGNPLAIVYPTDGALLMEDQSGILKGTKNPNAAKLLMEFLLGIEKSEIAVADENESMRPEVKNPPGVPPIDSIKTFRVPADELATGIPEVIEAWRDLFGV